MVSRYECLQSLAPKITNELVVTSIAGVAREWGHVKDRDGNLRQVFMASVTPIALGLALALPHRRVISLDGDGSMLMGLTVLPVIAAQNPSNLVVIVFDNEVYEAVNNMPTLTAGATDLVEIARGAGIKNARTIRELPEFEEAIDEAFKASGASFITVKVKPQADSPLFPYGSLDGTEVKNRFIRYVEKTENLEIIHIPFKQADAKLRRETTDSGS